MTTTHKCESCTMPIESGQYCSYCTDDAGALQPFDLRFEAMVSWSLKEDSSQSPFRS